MGVEVDINIFLGVSRGGINRRGLDIVVVGVEVVGSRSRSRSRSSSRSNSKSNNKNNNKGSNKSNSKYSPKQFPIYTRNLFPQPIPITYSYNLFL